VFATATLPRAAGGTLALLPGFPSGATVANSHYGVVPFDRDGNGAVDVIFLADDRAVLSGGGIQCWRLMGATWVLQGNVTGLSNGMRGLTGRTNGSDYVFYGTTTNVPSRLVRVDVFGATLGGNATTIATAAVNTAFRGVAFAPL
jgi:hypothetical protein